MGVLVPMAVLAAIIGGFISGILTYVWRGYTAEIRRRRKLIEILLHIRGELTSVQKFIDGDVLIPFNFDSFQLLKYGTVSDVIIELLQLRALELFAGLTHINMYITQTNYLLQRNDLLNTFPWITETFKDNFISITDQTVSKIRKELSPTISNCQHLIQDTFSELGKPFSIYIYVTSQNSTYIPYPAKA